MATTVNAWSSKAISEPKSESSSNSKFSEKNQPDNSLLLKKISLLQAMVDKLEAEKESLAYTCSDLKQLLQCVTSQHDKEAARKRKIMQEYTNKIRQLESALNVSEIHSSHMSSIKSFWEEVIDN